MSIGESDIMASMTVEFFKVELKNQASKAQEDYRVLKEIIDEILSSTRVQDGYKSIDISPDISPNDVEPKEVIDLFDDPQYLFGRVCRKKPNNAILKRDYSTLQAQEVFAPEELNSRGIELFTFFILDYDKGILSIVNAKGAPGKSSISSLVELYKPEFCLEFVDIPNADGIKLLYDSALPELSKLEFDVPTPNAEFLQRVLNLDEDVIREMIQDNVMTASILLKPVPYGKLLRNKENIKNILDVLFRKKGNFSKTVVRGNSEKFSSRNFDLNAQFFTYPIDVKTYRVIRGKKVNYSLMDVVEQFRVGLHRAYEDNYDIITSVSNR